LAAEHGTLKNQTTKTKLKLVEIEENNDELESKLRISTFQREDAETNYEKVMEELIIMKSTTPVNNPEPGLDESTKRANPKGSKDHEGCATIGIFFQTRGQIFRNPNR
jgi:hypothetical protein